MIGFLFARRDLLLAGWCVCWVPFLLPSRGWLPSFLPLAAGLALRAWARRHIGPHSRGRKLECPERSTGGPYRWFPHPLYLANLLVLAGLACCAVGPAPVRCAAILSGPAVLYALLAHAESRLLRSRDPAARSVPFDAATGRWRSEWASFLPPLALWILAVA